MGVCLALLSLVRPPSQLAPLPFRPACTAVPACLGHAPPANVGALTAEAGAKVHVNVMKGIRGRLICQRM
jgi:hypothetical protein